MIKPCKKVITKDHSGKVNGWLLEVNSVHDGFTDHIQGQVYMTVATPGAVKGFHLHQEKQDQFTCIYGNIKLVTFENGAYKSVPMGEGNYCTVKVPPGIPHAIYNCGDKDAYILNYCYPAWRPDHEDIQAWHSDYKFE